MVVMRPQLGTVTDVPPLFANLPCPRVTENSVSVDVRAKIHLTEWANLQTRNQRVKKMDQCLYPGEEPSRGDMDGKENSLMDILIYFLDFCVGCIYYIFK